MKPLKTFEDLVFQKHAIAIEAEESLKKDKSLLPLSLYKKACNAKHAVMDFPNGYGISVVFGEMFYSNGIDTYEVAVTKGGEPCYDTPITNDVMGRLNKEEVTSIMKGIQLLPDAKELIQEVV